MANNNIERIKQLAISLLKEDYLAGRLPVPFSFGTPYDFKVVDITYLERVFDFFADSAQSDQVKEILDNSINSVNDFQNYLRGLEFLNSLYNPKPEIVVHFPKKEDELDGPKLDSFTEDNRVIVKALKHIFTKWNVKAEACFDFGCRPFECIVHEPTMTKLRRNYGVEPTVEVKEVEKVDEYMINIQRCPIVFNCGAPALERCSGLAYDVLLNQFEPFTSTRILRDELGSNTEGEAWVFDAITSQRRYEEELVANALVKGWLIERWAEKFDFSSFGNFRNFSPRDVETALRQVREKGPEEVASFYCSDDWNLEDFLRE